MFIRISFILFLKAQHRQEEHHILLQKKQHLTAVIPEVIVAEKAVGFRLRDSDIDGSCSVHGLQEVPDVDGLVVRWRVGLTVTGDEQDLSKRHQQQQTQQPEPRTHLLRLQVSLSPFDADVESTYIGYRRLIAHTTWFSHIRQRDTPALWLVSSTSNN